MEDGTQPGVQPPKKEARDFNERKLPSSLKVLTEDGMVKDEALDMAQNLIPCCGAPPPLGAWYGPFGFFRWMGYVFFCLHIWAIFATIYAGAQQDWYPFTVNIFLVFSALIAAISSYCHEGLSNEVLVFAKHNDEFAAQNETLSAQVKDLQAVRNKYEGLLEDLQGDETTLKDLVESLHRVVLMKNLETIFRAFLEADSNNTASIGPKEADMFFSNTWQVLKYASGDFSSSEYMSSGAENKSQDAAQCRAFPLGTLYKEAVNAIPNLGNDFNGLDTSDVKLLVYAVGLSGDPEKPFASRALLWMVLFCFNPEVYADGLTESLINCILGASDGDAAEEKLRESIKEIRNDHPAAFKYSSDRRCVDLVQSILNETAVERPPSRRNPSSRPPR